MRNSDKLKLKINNITFYDLARGHSNITQENPPSDFIESKFKIKLDYSSLVCDLGCGTASNLLSLNIKEKVGLDVSLGNLIIAKNRSSVLSLVRGDAEHLPFRQAVFGAILIVDLLHHIPDPHIVIKEVAGIIVNGGTLFMWDACANGIMPIYPLAILAQQCSWKIGLMIEHLGPDLNDIIMWLAESGFTILNVIGEGTFIRFIGSLLDSFCKRLKIPLPFTITKFLSSIDQKATRLFKKFPIKFGIVAIKQF